MGHQVIFYATPAGMASVETAIRRIEPLLILHSRSPVAEPRVVSSSSLHEGQQPWLFFYLVRERDLPLVVTNHVAAQGYWTIDVLCSPVVELDKCFFDQKILRRGRVYYTDGFYGPDDSWVEKPEAFRSWAKSVLAVTRKQMKKRGNEYVGTDALQWLEESGGKLVD